MNEVAEGSTELSKVQGVSRNPAKKRCSAEGSVTFSCRLPPAPGLHPPAIPPEAASPPTVTGRRGNALCSGPPPVRGDWCCPTASLSSTYPCQLLRVLDSKSLDNTQLSSLPSRYFSDNSVVLTIQGKGYSKWSNVKIHIEL